jgi:hypothetical protein
MRTRRLWLESLEGRENPAQLSLPTDFTVQISVSTVNVEIEVTPFASQPVDSTGNPLPSTGTGGTGTSGSGNGSGTATGGTGTSTGTVPIVPIVPPVIRIG